MALVENRFTAIPINLDALIQADYGAAACLITFAAITGKCSFPQIFILATLEMIFYTLNVVICKGILKAVDVGGGMTIHLFGGYFGVICAFFFNGQRAIEDFERRGKGGYTANTIAFIGTMFLFMYFPSFNAAMLEGAAQQRAIINTLLSITTSAITACFVNSVYEGKFNFQLMMTSTLAGGVAMGSAADLIYGGYPAMIVGFVAGIVSSIGFMFINKSLSKGLGLHDTCGVHFTHAMPGIIAGIASAVAVATTKLFYVPDYVIMQTYPVVNLKSCLNEVGVSLTVDKCRSLQDQAWF